MTRACWVTRRGCAHPRGDGRPAGACALGDIGHLFPDSDPAYAGADSLRLLDEVVSRLRQRGYRVAMWMHRAGPGPKTGPLSGANAPESGLAAPGAGGRCQRQGTTEEGLGFTGTGDGIAAHAVCLVENLL